MICHAYKSFFIVLADNCRLNIINLLSKGPLTVSDLCTKLGYEQSRVSHGLRTLKEHGFVVGKVKGKTREYALEPKLMIPLLKIIDEHVDKYHKQKCKCKCIRWRDMA
ncbi:transcriptional regulator [Candidatus Woesearchaeota archaeon CG10_big_fil_rev_8_21_14_0_10_37_12]|nr:MAG: transcriptional regulator [Candidatus Woesearchaeota archaeon CG10_big_fil_rev_8_21_14_0_10_37_12]